jgi:hypothetical protein
LEFSEDWGRVETRPNVIQRIKKELCAGKTDLEERSKSPCLKCLPISKVEILLIWLDFKLPTTSQHLLNM